jgi:hypothetical protein
MEEYPKASSEDKAVEILEALIGVIPLAGTGIALLKSIADSPLAQRRAQWFNNLGLDLKHLIEKYENITPDELSKNEIFVSTLVQATQAAIKTHQQEKLKYLRNAVLNSALPNPPDESQQQIFVRWLDEFTVWHVELLKLFRGEMPSLELNRDDWRIQMNVDRTFEVVCNHYPEMKAQYDLFLTILEDLARNGIIANTHPSAMMMSRRTSNPEITRLGNAFLKFIESPLDKN